MNIKIPKHLAEILLSNTINTIQFGNPEGEDTDLLHIVQPCYQMDMCAVDNNHTLFYKDEDNKTDHLFITPRGFVNGVVSGSNTLFIEMVLDGSLENTCISFMLENQPSVYLETYKVLKAFIGCSERDFKQAKGHKDTNKKLKWAKKYNDLVRGYLNLPLNDDSITAEEIKETRSVLNRAYQVEGAISFSVSSKVFKELQDYLYYMKTLDIRKLNALSLHYYENWSEN